MRERPISHASQPEPPLYLSVVIPALNEANRLPATFHKLREYLRGQAFSWEIIVVSNGSTDGTDDLVRRWTKNFPSVRLVSLSRRGKGIATREGVLESRGDVVFLCDADLSMPACQISEFLERLDSVDIVVGSREVPGARRFAEPPYRHLMGRIFNRLVQWLAVPGIEDTQCGFKAFRRRPAEELFARQSLSGFGFDVEILYLARKFGYSVAEIPIDWYFDRDTRVRPFVDSLTMFSEVLSVRLRDLLGRYPRKSIPVRPGEDVA